MGLTGQRCLIHLTVLVDLGLDGQQRVLGYVVARKLKGVKACVVRQATQHGFAADLAQVVPVEVEVD